MAGGWRLAVVVAMYCTYTYTLVLLRAAIVLSVHLFVSTPFLLVVSRSVRRGQAGVHLAFGRPRRSRRAHVYTNDSTRPDPGPVEVEVSRLSPLFSIHSHLPHPTHLHTLPLVLLPLHLHLPGPLYQLLPPPFPIAVMVDSACFACRRLLHCSIGAVHALFFLRRYRGKCTSTL